MAAENIETLEEASRNQFERTFGGYLALVDDALSILEDGIAPLNDERLPDAPSRARTWLALRHYNALTAARSNMARGYGTAGAVLVRTAFEAWATQKFIANHPEKAGLYTELDLVSPFKPTEKAPQFASIWKELAGKGAEEAPRIYAWLSSYAHPSAVSLRATYDRTPAGFVTRSEPSFNESLVRQTLAGWFQVAQLQLRATQELQALVLGKPDEAWTVRGFDLSAKLVDGVRDLTEQIMNSTLDRIGSELNQRELSIEDLVEAGRQERDRLLQERHGQPPGQPKN